MKRLTISMSDELFDKLDSIENKSLFIRKLIERELDMLDSIQDIDSSIPWERDIAALKGNIDELFTKLSDIEKQLNTRVMQEIPTEAQSCLIQTNHDEQPGTLEINSSGLSEPAIFEHEETGQNPFANDNIEHQPEISDEKIPVVPEQIQEDKYSFLIQGETPMDPQPRSPMEYEEEDALVLLETEPASEIIKADPLPELEPPEKAQQEQAFVMPELKQPVETQQEQAFVMPELEHPVETQQEQAFVMPELEHPVETQQEPAFVMPELKPPVETTDSTQAPVPGPNPPFEIAENEPFVMPELSAPEGAEQAPSFMSEMKPPFENTDQPFTMPDLKTPAGTEEAGTFKLPELQPETVSPLKMTEQQNAPVMEKQPLFKIHNIDPPRQEEKLPPFVAPAFDTQPENAQAPPFEIPAQKTNPPAQQPPMRQPVKDTTMEAPARNSSSKPDKLGSNILMYMPHGAKVKKDIIKSLISKKFSENEIEVKISELVSAGVLKLAAENENQYLIRP
ncbi:MAG: hypothetical protein SCH66_04700 [Methanolobus sp.]|nr:hypothetical protein [Methanolobus sp.]